MVFTIDWHKIIWSYLSVTQTIFFPLSNPPQQRWVVGSNAKGFLFYQQKLCCEFRCLIEFQLWYGKKDNPINKTSQKNKRSNRTAIFSVKVAHLKLNKHTRNHFYIKAKIGKNISMETLSKEFVKKAVKSTLKNIRWTFSNVQPFNFPIWGKQSEIVPTKKHFEIFHRQFRLQKKPETVVSEKDDLK